VSNVQWDGLNLFKSFLSMLPISSIENELKSIETEKMEFDIHETLAIDNKLIVTGIVNKGKVVSDTKCYLGPDNDGKFKIVEIVNIHCKKIPVKYSYKGQYCSIYIKNQNGLTKEDVRKGMVLLDINALPLSAKMFEVELWTIDGTKKLLKYKYQPILNIKHIRQGAKIKNINDIFIIDDPNILNSNRVLENLIMDDTINFENAKFNLEKIKLENNNNAIMKNQNKKTTINNGINYNTDEAVLITSTNKTKIIFEFMFNPEYLTVGSHVIINDQLIKAYGIVTRVLK
jgi:GTPase